jgi:hypothetical protein
VQVCSGSLADLMPSNCYVCCTPETGHSSGFRAISMSALGHKEAKCVQPSASSLDNPVSAHLLEKIPSFSTCDFIF